MISLVVIASDYYSSITQSGGKAESLNPRKFVGARQLVRGHGPAGAAPSGTRGRHTPALAHQLASARENLRNR
jgi:hypothetical protein